MRLLFCDKLESQLSSVLCRVQDLYNNQHYTSSNMYNTMKKKRILLYFISLIVVSLIYVKRFANHKTTPIVKSESKMKHVIFWNKYFTFNNLGFGETPFEGLECKVNNCVFWNHMDDEPDLPYEEYDAVIFHGIDFLGSSRFIGQPPVRLPHQRYIIALMESPAMHKTNFKYLPDFFNWTYTYRTDSDIYRPYGWIRNISESSHAIPLPSTYMSTWKTPDFDNMKLHDDVRRKTKLVAWFSSNCMTDSLKELYVLELSKHVEVDVYGLCGTRNCGNEHCYTMVDEEYKFILALENSLCEDYVSEKFFKALSRNAVPIVYGGVDYEKLAPPLSYINVQDFDSPKHLAEFLLFLDKNQDEYEKFFWWKSHYVSVTATRYSLCQLCEKLNDPSLPKKVYNDIDYWWNHNECHSPYDHFSGGNKSWVPVESASDILHFWN